MPSDSDSAPRTLPGIAAGPGLPPLPAKSPPAPTRIEYPAALAGVAEDDLEGADDDVERNHPVARTALAAAHYDLAEAIAQSTVLFNTERYTPPSSPQLGKLRFWTRRKGRGDSAPIDRHGRFKKMLEHSVNSEVLHIESKKKWDYTRDVLIEIATGETMPYREKEGGALDLEKRCKQDVRSRIEGKWQAFEAVMPEELKAHKRQFLEKINLKDYFAAPYLHVLCPDRIVKDEYEEVEGETKFADSTVILPLTHQLEMIKNAKQDNSTWSAKHLPLKYKLYSIDNTAHVFPLEWLTHKIRTKLPKRMLGIPTGSVRLDVNRHGISMDNIDEYVTFQYIFKEAPALIGLFQDMADTLDDDFRIDYDRVKAGVEYVKNALQVDAAHAANETDLKRALKDSPTLTYDNIVPAELVGSTPKGRPVGEFFTYLNNMKNLARIKVQLEDSLLAGWSAADSSLDENIIHHTDHLKNRKEAWLLRDDHGFPVLESRLLAHHKFTFGLAHAVNSIMHEARKDAMPFMMQLEHYLPGSEEALKRIKNTVDRFVSFFVSPQNDTYKGMYRIAFDHHHSVLPPKRIGAFLYDHRWVFACGLGVKFLRGAWDHRHGGKVDAFFEKLGNAISTKQYARFLFDIMTYRPEDAHQKSYGPIETALHPAAERALEFVVNTRLDRTYREREAKHLYKTLGNAMQVDHDNVNVRFALAMLQLATGRLDDADDHLQDVRAWIDPKKHGKYDDADQEEIYFLQHQMLPAVTYYHAHLARKERGHRQGYTDLLREAYIQYHKRTERVDETVAGGTARIRLRRERTFDFTETVFDDPKELMHELLYSPLNFNYRRQAIELLYAKKEHHAEARRATQRVLNEITELSDILSDIDTTEAFRIVKIAKHHGVAVPHQLSAYLGEREEPEGLPAYAPPVQSTPSHPPPAAGNGHNGSANGQNGSGHAQISEHNGTRALPAGNGHYVPGSKPPALPPPGKNLLEEMMGEPYLGTRKMS